MRHAYPGNPGIYGYGPYNPPNHGTGPSAEGDRLSQIKHAIDSIEQRLGAANAPRNAAPYANYGMGNQPHPAGMDSSHFAAQAQSNSQLGMLQAQLNQLASQIGSPAPMQWNGGSTPQQSTDFNSVASEIARRQQALNSGNMGSASSASSGAQSATAHSPTESQYAKAINAQLKELKNEIVGIRQQVQKPAVDQSEIDKIASAIASLQAKSQPKESDFDRLSSELNQLRAAMQSDVGSMRGDLLNTVRSEVSADRSSFASNLNSRIDSLGSEIKDQLNSGNPAQAADMNARLDGLARNLEELAAQSANTVAPKVEQLAGQLDYLRMSVDDLPQTLAISRLEDRLGDLTQKLEVLTQQSAQAPVPVAASEQEFESIERRLDEISRALVAVSNMGGKSPSVDLSAVDRVEARMSELARTIDAIAERDNVSEFQDLATRIDGLTERLGSFEKYAESGDLGAASAMFAAPDTGVIEEQLRVLNDRVQQAAAGSQIHQLDEKIAGLVQQFEAANANVQTHAIEQQIAQLSQQIEQNSNVHSTAAQMSNLEAQIGQIIRHMNKQPSSAQVDFAPVESRLGQIEQHLVNGQGFSIEAAQQAAQQAVQMMGPQSESGQVIEALSHDLRALHEAAEGGNAQNAQTIQQLQDMLGQVVDRLGSIEGAIEQAATKQEELASSAAQPMPRAANLLDPQVDRASHEASLERQSNETAFAADVLADVAADDGDMGVIHRAAVEAGYIGESDIPQEPRDHGHMESPSVDPTADIERAIASSPEDNMPLEPGSVGSDVERLVEEASAKLSQTREQHDAPQIHPEDRPNPVSSQDDIRPDAVAAARRALQATTAEMNSVREEAGREKESSSAGGLQGKLEKLLPNFDMSKLRKPLVLGAAALLLAIVAFKGIGMFTGAGDEKPVAMIDVPAIESTNPAKTANEPADVRVIGDDVKPTANASGGEATKVAPSADIAANTMEDKASAVGSDSMVAEPQPEKAVSSEGQAATTTLGENGQTQAETETVSVNPENQPTIGQRSTYDVPSKSGPAALVAAASAGDPAALFQIGMRYSEGEDVKRNMTESAKWFERAADLGFAPAQYSIGSLFEKGIGVERNIQKASQWYEKAAVQGNARAMHNLAVIYAMGNPPETQPNMDTAVGWFQQAADLGIKDSQFNLGILYGQGMGVPQNLIESYKWFALAAKTGDSDANKKRDEVANAMDPDDLDDARKAVNNWAPSKLKESVNRVKVPAEWKGKGTASNASSKVSGLESVKQAQLLLNQRGFSVGEPDGKIGPKTKRAIMEFQRSAGIPITGKVDKKLMQALDLQT